MSDLDTFAKFVKDNGLGADFLAVGGKLIETLMTAASTGKAPDLIDAPKWNRELHAAEGNLDARIKKIREMRNLLEDAAAEVLDAILDLMAGEQGP